MKSNIIPRASAVLWCVVAVVTRKPVDWQEAAASEGAGAGEGAAGEGAGGRGQEKEQ